MTSDNIILYTALSLLSAKTSRPFLNKLKDGTLDNHDISEIYNNHNILPHLMRKYPGSAYDSACKIIEYCNVNNIEITNISSEKYPSLLKEIATPPIVIYSKGNSFLNNCVSIVGTRNSDQISSDICYRISSELSQMGFTIVSGLAEGIDRSAHLAALDNRGSTAGVMAGGIDTYYPRSNMDIFGRINESEKSFLLSENPPGAGYFKWTFIQRNRIISGLSRATIIVQASIKSGAMITANYAVEQNRELFVCTGNAYDSSYSGCIQLLRQGAHLFTDTENMLMELGIKTIPSREKKTENSNKVNLEQKLDQFTKDILLRIKEGLNDADRLMEIFGMEISTFNEKIMIMEIKGLLRREGNTLVLQR